MHVGMQLMSWHEPKPAGIRSGDAEDLVAGFLPGDMPRWGSRYCTLVCSHMSVRRHRPIIEKSGDCETEALAGLRPWNSEAQETG
jgi:hypothetical protein